MELLVLVLKVALIAFNIAGTAALILRAVRRARANRRDPRWNACRSLGQPGYEAMVYGAMPNTPLPEWAFWDDEDTDLDETD